MIQREVADPVGYVNLWLADASEPADPRRVNAWLDWFDAHKVEAVGFGLITARRGGHDDPVIRIEDLSKVYRLGLVDVQALRGVNLEVGKGEFLAVVGPSGSGKSTMFHILGGLTPPTSGRTRSCATSSTRPPRS